MANAWAALLGSRKFWIGTLSVAATIIVNVLAIFGKVPKDQVWPLVTGIVTMGGTVIAGTALEDGALKFGVPPQAQPAQLAPPQSTKTPSTPPDAGGIAGALLLGVALLGAGACLEGCSADANRKVVNATLDTAQVVCVLARSEFADEAAIMKACDIADELEPVVHAILGQHRQSVAAAAAAGACGRDGGAR